MSLCLARLSSPWNLSFWIVVSLAFGVLGSTTQTTGGAGRAAQLDPSLPTVLILGDSISVGYTRDVRAFLAGKANVLRPLRPGGRAPVNCESTLVGVRELRGWLGGARYDVIHFNWGLHDIHHRNALTKQPKLGDKLNLAAAIPLAQYRANLDYLVRELGKTGAKLIWASTTVVPGGDPGRVAGEEKTYNDAARDVMTAHGIVVNDLHALTAGFPKELFAGPGNVHYTAEGYRRIARQVAVRIERALSPKASRNLEKK